MKTVFLFIPAGAGSPIVPGRLNLDSITGWFIIFPAGKSLLRRFFMRKRIYEVIELAKENDRLSAIYDSSMILVIVLSLLPLLYKETPGALLVLDKVCVVIFMADYLLLPVGDRLIFATHGHIFNETQLPPLRPGDILLHGHTHVAACVEHETYTYCNPGSVALPKAGAPHSYMTLEDGIFRWKKLDGTVYHTL